MRDRGRVREHGQERGKNGRDGNLCVQKVSVSTGPARGNTVDGLPRASKFLEQQAGQIVAKVACGFSKNIFTKMEISRAPVDIFG